MVRTPKTLAIQQENLERRLSKLSEDYAAVNGQIDREGDADKRLQLKRKADDFLEQMKEVEIELNQLEDCNQDLNKMHLDIQEKLPAIDFREAMSSVENITRKFGREGGAAFFILDNTYSMAGENCIFRIREKFQEKTSNFKHIKVELSYTVHNELGLLEGIGKYLNVHRAPEDNIENYLKQIIEIICQSLQSGSVLFIEIKKWDCLPEQERILPWFLTSFWTRLIEQYRITTQTKELRRVKCVALIDLESKLSQECIKLPCYCTHENFESQKLVRLPLSAWTEEDIKEWLEDYTGLPGPKIDIMARQIYSKTMDGVPFMVCEAIKKEFTKIDC